MRLGSRVRGTRAAAWVWRVVHEFAVVPFSVIAGFVVLAAATIVLDQLHAPWLAGPRRALGHLVGQQAAQSALSAIATGMVTVASITFSLLLLAVQQTASSLSPVVFDQFVRRRANQVYLGFFVGLSLYSYLVLTAVQKDTPPTLGASVAIALTVVALLLLVLLVYTTLDQMRPVNVLRAIAEHAVAARAREADLLRRTLRDLDTDDPVHARCVSEASGYVIGIDIDAVLARLQRSPRTVVRLRVTLGSYLATGDLVALVHDDDEANARAVADDVRAAVAISPQRDLDLDATAGVDEVANIAWTSTSSAKQNPEIARQALDTLRELAGRWGDSSHDAASDEARVVYPDNDEERVVDAMLSLLVAAHESQQHQTTARTLDALAGVLPRLPWRLRHRVATALRDTAPLIAAQARLPLLTEAVARAAVALAEAGHADAAAALRQAA